MNNLLIYLQAVLTFSLLLMLGIDRKSFGVVGALGIAALMGCFLIVHLRVKSPWSKTIPCLILLAVSLTIALINYRLLNS